MKPETEQNIEKTLKLLEGIKGATAPPGFTQKVLARLDNVKTQRIIPMRTVWAAAAAIALLLMLNVWVGWGYKTPQHAGHPNNMQQVATEMGLTQEGFWY